MLIFGFSLKTFFDMNFFSVFFSFELIDMKPFQQEAGWGAGWPGGGRGEAEDG